MQSVGHPCPLHQTFKSLTPCLGPRQRPPLFPEILERPELLQEPLLSDLPALGPQGDPSLEGSGGWRLTALLSRAAEAASFPVFC